MKSKYLIHVYSNGTVEVIKNKYDKKGIYNLKETISLFSRIIADYKLRKTNLKIFKAGLALSIQEEIEKILEGEYNETSI